MSLVKDLRVLIAPAFITLPLVATPAALLIPVEIAVITAWTGLLFCRLFRNSGLIFSVIALAILAYIYGGELTKYEGYWFYLCLASLCASLFVYTTTVEPPQNKIPAATPKDVEPEPEVKVDPEVIELRKQLQQLVQWQYRAVEAEQALEQEKALYSQNVDNASQASAKVIELEQTLRIAQSQIASYQEAGERIDENKVLFEKLKEEHAQVLENFVKVQAEHADLTTCFRHLNEELRLAEEKCKQIQVKEEVENTLETPQDLLSAWQEADREYRRYRGLHQQLREQFETQSQALEEARKDRFIALEELNSERIKLKESQWEDAQSHLEHTSKLVAELSAKEEELLALEELITKTKVPRGRV
ncbi:MAG: hypothetical protein WC222_04955 [Parachlamydiales bacterium]|jgi:hypothetical protein